LVIADITSRPMRGITRGEITNRQQVSESVREIVREVEGKLGMNLSDLYTGTSGRHVRCAGHDYYVFVGERSDGEIRQEDMDALHEGMNNVQAEDGLRIMDRIPQKYVVDGRDVVKDPVGRFGKKLESTFNFVLGSATLIDRLEKTLIAVGTRSRKTYPNALASAEAVVLPEEKEMGVAVVDLGAGTTDVCVWHDNAVRFVRGIPFGTADIDSDIHQQGILEKHVEGLKTSFGVAMADLVTSDKLIAIAGRSPREKQEISQRNLATIIEHRLREIIGFVVDEIGDSGYGGRLRGGIVLTGGGSRLDGIDTLVREITGMEVRLALPDVRVADESLPLAQDPAHATVIGLLLKAMAEASPATVAVKVSKPEPPTPEPEPEKEPEKRPKRKKERGGIKRWFEGFLSEPLDGDEDF
jgi:cell division protein FtsA